MSREFVIRLTESPLQVTGVVTVYNATVIHILVTNNTRKGELCRVLLDKSIGQLQSGERLFAGEARFRNCAPIVIEMSTEKYTSINSAIQALARNLIIKRTLLVQDVPKRRRTY